MKRRVIIAFCIVALPVIALSGLHLSKDSTTGVNTRTEAPKMTARTTAPVPPKATVKLNYVSSVRPSTSTGSPTVATDPAINMIIPNAFLTPAPPGGVDQRITSIPKDPAVVDGAISFYDLVWKYQNLAEKIGANTLDVVVMFGKCMDGLKQRGVELGGEHTWMVGLHLKGDGKRVRVERAITVDAHWPTYFDEEARQCWVDATSLYAFEFPEPVDMVVEWSTCINASTNDSISEEIL